MISCPNVEFGARKFASTQVDSFNESIQRTVTYDDQIELAAETDPHWEKQFTAVV
jgi:hypothetical protein